MTRLFATFLLFVLPAIALAHPHDPPEPDEPPKTVIKKMMKSDHNSMATDDTNAKKIIKKRVVIKADNTHEKKPQKVIGLTKDSRLIDLGDGMVAKIDGDETMILVDGAVLGPDLRADENVTVEKIIRIEDGRKKTRITIELDAPAQ